MSQALVVPQIFGYRNRIIRPTHFIPLRHPLPFKAKHIHPRNWSVTCWMIFSMWLAFTGWVNFPYVMTGAAANHPSSELYEPLTEYGTVSTQSGWPFPYMECTNAKTKAQYWLDFFPLLGLLDLLIALITLASIVVVMQTWGRRLSIIALFVVIGAVSILLVVGRGVYATSNNYLVFLFVVGIYLSPVWLAVILLNRRHFQSRIAV